MPYANINTQYGEPSAHVLGIATSNLNHTAEYHEQYEKEHWESCPKCRDAETSDELPRKPVEFEHVSPTYVIRLSNPRLGLDERPALAIALRDAIGDNGASIRWGVGIWQGGIEDDIEITIQADMEVLQKVLDTLARNYPEEQWVHVEFHDVPTSYVNLDERRA